MSEKTRKPKLFLYYSYTFLNFPICFRLSFSLSRSVHRKLLPIGKCEHCECYRDLSQASIRTPCAHSELGTYHLPKAMWAHHGCEFWIPYAFQQSSVLLSAVQPSAVTKIVRDLAGPPRCSYLA